jgi:surface protein
MDPVSKWYHKRPKSYYPKCIEMFGEPTSISNTKHGFAFWKTRGLFDEHILRDEDVKHCVPRNHHDYFYSSIKFFIPEDKVFDVLKISGSINYDGLKNLITARCGGIGANYATLYLGMMVAMGNMTIKEVQSGDLYPKHISGEMKTYNEMKKEMMAMKRANHKKFKKELKQDFASYAFKQCYKEKSGGGNCPGGISCIDKTVRSDDDIKEAVRRWCQNRDKAVSTYGDISQWDTSKVTNMSDLFKNCQAFNDDISGWNVGKVTNMQGMFRDALAFDQPLGNWNVSNVTNMGYMFREARAFNQPIGQWNVGKVTNMRYMFYYARAFNQPLKDWNVSNVTDMESMFYYAPAFNQPLENWNVSNVTNMGEMLSGAAAFNQPLEQWNVSNVTTMEYMFLGASSFNQPLANWERIAGIEGATTTSTLTNVTNMEGMFIGADSFDHNISNWYIPGADTTRMFNENYHHPKPSARSSKQYISNLITYRGRRDDGKGLLPEAAGDMAGEISNFGGGKRRRTRRVRKSRKTRSKRTQKNKTASKEKPVGKGLTNTRDEDCMINGSTGCCPHMGPDEKGRYRATNEKTTLTYDNKKYELHTCCMMCADAMSALAKSDPVKFEASYVSRYLANGDMVARNHHTKKEVQVLKLKK